jgi:hypothetical protein
MVSLSKDCESPCVTQKGGDQNGVTGPRDPSEVSTHESSRVLHSEREPSFPLCLCKSLGRGCTLKSSGNPPRSSHCVSLSCVATQQVARRSDHSCWCRPWSQRQLHGLLGHISRPRHNCRAHSRRRWKLNAANEKKTRIHLQPISHAT